jgi:NADP-dependent 3-hydroxy acid dehydrogenase YdfG
VAFAQAGTAKLILLGRTEASLKVTAALTVSVPTAIYVADTTNARDLQEVAAAVGTWDILILSAGYVSSPSTMLSAKVDDWWQNFEVSLFASRANFTRVL